MIRILFIILLHIYISIIFIAVTYQQLQFWKTKAYIVSQNQKYERRIIQEEINRLENNNIIIDGIRNIEEIELFMKIGEVKIILIRNTPKKRMKLLQERKRNDAPINIKEFNKRDEKELKIGIEGVMKRADITIDNINLSKEEFEEKTRLIINNFSE